MPRKYLTHLLWLLLLIGGLSSPIFAISSPTEVSGIKLWFDASDVGTITKDGSNRVGSWTDKSGNSYTVSQGTTGYKPIWHNNVQNGLGAIRFDGTDDVLQKSGSMFSGSTNRTFFIVYKSNDNSGSVMVADGKEVTSGRWNITNEPAVLVSGGNRKFNRTTASTAEGYQILVVRLNGANVNITEAWVNGELLTQKSAISRGVDTQSGYFKFGVSIENSGQFNGDIAEVIAYSSALSDTNRQLVENYLATKWGIDDTDLEPDYPDADSDGTPDSQDAFPNDATKQAAEVSFESPLPYYTYPSGTTQVTISLDTTIASDYVASRKWMYRVGASVGSSGTGTGTAVALNGTATLSVSDGNSYVVYARLVNSSNTIITSANEVVQYIKVADSFTPSDISGLRVWLDGSDPAGTGTPPSDGATVSSWIDKGGLAYHSTSGTPASYDTDGLNGNGAIYFDNSDYYLFDDGIFNNSEYTIFAVFRMDSGNIGPVWGYNNEEARSQWFPKYSNGNMYFPKDDSAWQVTTSPLNDGVAYMTTSVFTNTQSTNYVNGEMSQTSTRNTITTSELIVAKRGTEYFDGHIAEIIVYNSTLSTANRSTVESYLNSKWNLNSLPSINHIPSISTTQNIVATFDVTISDSETDNGLLTLSFESSNTSLIDADYITSSNASGTVSVTLTPKEDQYGSAVITLHVYDGVTSSSATFNFTVAQTDSDGDGTPDVDDEFPFDPALTGFSKNALNQPVKLDSLVLWLNGRFPRGNAKPSHNVPIKTWIDLSPSANHATFVDSFPRYNANALGNKGAVAFTNDQMITPTINLGADYTILVTAKRTGGGADDSIISMANDTNRFNLHYEESGSAINAVSYTTSTNYVSAEEPVPTPNQFNVFVFTHDADYGVTTYVNGYETGYTATTAGNTGADNIALGHLLSGDTASKKLTGEIGEVMVYNERLTSVDLMYMIKFMAFEWDLGHIIDSDRDGIVDSQDPTPFDAYGKDYIRTGLFNEGEDLSSLTYRFGGGTQQFNGTTHIGQVVAASKLELLDGANFIADEFNLTATMDIQAGEFRSPSASMKAGSYWDMSGGQAHLARFVFKAGSRGSQTSGTSNIGQMELGANSYYDLTAGALISTQSIDIQAGSTFNMTNGTFRSPTTNIASKFIFGGGESFINEFYVTANGQVIQNNGTQRIKNALIKGRFNFSGGELISTGTFTVNPTATFNVTGGVLDLQHLRGKSLFEIQGGLFKVDRTGGSVEVSNTIISPGDSPGFMYVSGNYVQNAGSTLNMELEGTNGLTPDYDQLIVSNNITINGGALVITKLNGFEPSDGDIFDLLDVETGIITGNFDTISLPTLNAYLAWSTANLFTTGEISVYSFNTAPTINIANTISTTENNVVTVSFTVGDAQTATSSLVVTSESSNPSLIPTTNISFIGTGASRIASFNPVAEQYGSATITVNVSDGYLSASKSFTFTVNQADTDGDGILDDNDTYPNDANRSTPNISVTYPTSGATFPWGQPSVNIVISYNVPSSFDGYIAYRTDAAFPSSGASGGTTINGTVINVATTQNTSYTYYVALVNTDNTIYHTSSNASVSFSVNNTNIEIELPISSGLALWLDGSDSESIITYGSITFDIVVCSIDIFISIT